MHRTIVAVATEHEAPEPALTLALSLARPLGADVVLAGVLERHGPAPQSGDPRLERLLAALDKLATTAPVDVPVVVDGTTSTSTVRGIQQLVTAHGAQLLVLGPSDRGSLGRAMFGDTAGNALFTATCAVAIAATDTAADAPRRIGVAWDGTPEAAEALEWAVQMAERTGGGVEIVHVTASAPDGPNVSGRDITAELETLRHAAERRAPTVATAAWGDPAELLVHVSERLDLLVMGSRAEGPVRRALHGSVSRSVVHDAHCPVLILPRGIHAPADTAAV